MAKKKKVIKKKAMRTRKPSYKMVTWLGIIIVLVVAVAIAIQYSNKNVYKFTCSDGKSITAKFNTGKNGSVDLTLSDGRKINLDVTASAGGARYANDDESIVFWNTGNTATLDEGNQTTYDNCITLSNQ